MASYNKFETFVGDLGLKVHNLNTDTVNIYLSNATPSASADSVKADLAEIATGNGYTGPVDITNTYSEASGTGTFAGTDQTFTAATGSMAAFQFVVMYNDTPTSPADPLISWWDHGAAVTLAVGESFKVDFGANIFTIA